MSLILEALRKSEAERRKAQIAEPFAAPAAPVRAQATTIPMWVWPALVTALAVTAWLLLGNGGVSADAGAAPVATITESPGSGIHNDAAPAFAASQPAANQTTTDSPTSATVTPPLPAEVRPPSAPTTSIPTAVAALPRSAAATAPPVAPAPGVTIAPSASSVVASTAPASVAPPSPLPPASPSPTAAPNRPVTTVASASPASGTAPMRLSDLGTADRQQLPPLKMSMHMWASETGKRFAIIDGQRVGEGDRVGSTVVESIDSEGVVLGWNGHRLRVPVR